MGESNSNFIITNHEFDPNKLFIEVYDGSSKIL